MTDKQIPGGMYRNLALAREASATTRRNKREVNKRRILELIAHGMPVMTAVAEVGITTVTYYQWRKEDPAFRDAVMSIRSDNYQVAQATQYKEFGPFRSHYLGHPSPPFHIRAVTELERLEGGEILLMLWPPEHGKTSLLEDFATWKIVCDRNVRITVGSEKRAHGEKVVSQVRRRLNGEGDFMRLIGDFGSFNMGDTSWRDDAFRVHGSSGEERDFTMSAIGIDGALQGTRADILFIDDIQGTKSMGRTDVILERIRQDWFSRSGAFGRIVIVGTRVAPDDVYQKLLDENLIDKLILFPAYKTTEDVWPEPDRKCYQPKKNPANLAAAEAVGSFLWPERYGPKDYLTMRINAGETAWARNFMQQAAGSGGGPFSESMLADASLPMVKVHDVPPRDLPHVVLAQDPGFGINATLAAAMGPKHMQVLDWRLDMGLENNQAILAVLEGFCETYHTRTHRIDTVILEDKAFQKGLVYDEGLKEMRKRWGFRVTGHQTGVNKYDPDFGVAAMARSFERGEILLPGADDSATLAAREILDRQLLAWRPGRRGTKLTQDLTMALWFAWMVWRRRRESLDSYAGTTNWTMQGLPWAPTSSGLLVAR